MNKHYIKERVINFAVEIVGMVETMPDTKAAKENHKSKIVNPYS